MAPGAVFLHIGSPKTGTTYVQDTLWHNREVLESAGVLLPGHYRYARVQAARDILRWDPDEHLEQPQTWRRLVAEVNRWSGTSAIVSQEFLCWATEPQIKAIVESFTTDSVRIVLTVRDLTRLVPAQWQTAMRQRNTWTLGEYADAVAGRTKGKKAMQAARHFWRRHDYGPIIARWTQAVGVDSIVVVTLPPSGSAPDELWRRFCEATDLDPNITAPGEASHESLGAASTELMRRLNQVPTVQDMPVRQYQRSVNGALSRRTLAARRSQEASFALPDEHQEWAQREASRLIDDISATKVRVIGDLDDLRPQASKPGSVAPEELPDDVLLEAALDGLAGLAVEHAKLMRRLKKQEQLPGSASKKAGEAVRSGGVSDLRRAWRRRKPQ